MLVASHEQIGGLGLVGIVGHHGVTRAAPMAPIAHHGIVLPLQALHDIRIALVLDPPEVFQRDVCRRTIAAQGQPQCLAFRVRPAIVAVSVGDPLCQFSCPARCVEIGKRCDRRPHQPVEILYPALQQVEIEILFFRKSLDFAIALGARRPRRFQIASQLFRLAEFLHMVSQPFLAISVKPLTALGKLFPEERGLSIGAERIDRYGLERTRRVQKDTVERVVVPL